MILQKDKDSTSLWKICLEKLKGGIKLTPPFPVQPLWVKIFSYLHIPKKLLAISVKYGFCKIRFFLWLCDFS